MAMAQRSPHYPALSLGQAVEAVRKLWNREKRTAVSNATAATALGFQSLSGPARVAIGALRQYGLIAKADTGHLRVSDAAIAILLADSDEARLAGLKKAAVQPELFAELLHTHGEASENAIRSHLILKKGFHDEGARKAAKKFKETLALAQIDASGYIPDDEQETPEDMAGNDIGQHQDAGLGRTGGAAGKPSDGVFSMNVPFAKGTISVQVRVTGDAISPAHLARVRKYLELAESEWNAEE
jgi:hypothetical protein